MRCAAHPQVAAGACPAVLSVRVPQQHNLWVLGSKFLAHCQRVIRRAIFYQQHFTHFGLGKRRFNRLPDIRRGIVDRNNDGNFKLVYGSLNQSLRISALKVSQPSRQKALSPKAAG